MKFLLSLSVGTLAVAFFVFGMSGLATAATTIPLGTADAFSVLAGSAITSTGPSLIIGDVGLSPSAGSNYAGLTTGQVTGTIYAVDATGPAGIAGNNAGLLTSAKGALVTAYTIASGAVPVSTVPTELGGTVRQAGVYDSVAGTFGITGTLTLDAQGDPDAVFIFKSASTLITASASNVTLINSAQACNVFWQVGSSATLGTGSDFKGNILALSSITDNGGSIIVGRLLARDAAVTLNNTNITKATCASSTATTTPPIATTTPPIATSTPPTATTTPTGTPATTTISVIANSLTGIVVTASSTATSTPTATTTPPTATSSSATTSAGTLTGVVVTSSTTSTQTFVPSPSLGGGGGGPLFATGIAIGGDGNPIIFAVIPEAPEILGAVLGVSTDIPSAPNTGVGGGAPKIFLALIFFALFGFVSTKYLRYETG